MDATRDGIIIHDSGLIIEANDTVSTMFGCANCDLLWTQLGDWVTEDSRSVLAENLSNDLAPPCQVTGKRKDGTEFSVEMSSKAALVFKGRRVQVTTLRALSCSKGSLVA